MAGKLGVNTVRNFTVPTVVPLFKSNPRPSYPVKPAFCRLNQSLNRPCTPVIPMAQSDVQTNGFKIKELATKVRKLDQNGIAAVAADVQTNSFEIKEPVRKVHKLDQNGAATVVAPVDMSFLRVKKFSEKAVLPSRASIHSAGYDLSSAAEVKVPARGKAMVPTDLSIAILEGTYARVAPRSGLAWKHSIDVGAGVIDADYRVQLGSYCSTILKPITRWKRAIGSRS